MGNNGDKEDGNDSYSNLDKCINKDDDDKRSNEKPMMITIAIMIKATTADETFIPVGTSARLNPFSWP